MNPETNKFERLFSEQSDVLEKKLKENCKINPGDFHARLLRPNGEPVPAHWPVFEVGENVVLKNYTFKVAHIGESHLLLEPVGIVELGKEEIGK